MWTTILYRYTNERLMDEAWQVFGVMSERNVVSWNVMMIGLIRNGVLEEARPLFGKMEAKSVVPWNAMISGYVGSKGRRKQESCSRRWTREMRLLRLRWLPVIQDAQDAVQLDPMNAPGHTALCNIYAANGLPYEEKLLIREMGLKGVRKFLGCSGVSLQGQVRTFLSRDKLPAEAREMLSVAVEADNRDDDEQSFAV
ncbi:hypothetical protein MLD38_020838 [Melastoma candidum]|uniref:Uncharacterized protein n=1 Tax=Melastoma candidum TaxID=119954 RepID=A0ACB9QH66_9MYRT|nr:hypothetical protein MLD38_020838 [Melastoma candidum]